MRLGRALILGILFLVGCAMTAPTPLPTHAPTPVPSWTALPPPASEPSRAPAAAEPTMTAPLATADPVTSTAARDPTDPPPHPGLPLPTDRGALFAGAGVCATCHTNMVDQAGQDVSIDRFWRATMMANASRDPYWRATMRTETLLAPHLKAVIEDKCATCHTPLAHFSDQVAGLDAVLLDQGYLGADHPLHTLALDGVSCTLCHQIEETGLGEIRSFNGGFVIDVERPIGARIIFGPFPVGARNARIMQTASGYIPQMRKHVREAALCATCHTLYTPYTDADGEIVGEFPEQTPYLEWLSSDYRAAVSCQGCHMPKAQGGVVLSTTGGRPQQPFSQHSFVGGNAFMLRILQAFPDDNRVTAAGELFEAAIQRAQDQMANHTASVSIAQTSRTGDLLTADVSIVSSVGHKFPTGFPSRRAWIHLWVTDGSGQVIFESGSIRDDGAIEGNDNDIDPAAFEPHYTTVEQSDQVQIYEAIMGNTEGEVTTTLLRAASYLKDNRLLPAGFVRGNHVVDVAVHGAAAYDADFVGGGDQVQYRIDLSGAQGPFVIHAELLYQAISYRWAQNLAEHPSEAVEFFLDAYAAVPNTPLLVAGDSHQVP